MKFICYCGNDSCDYGLSDEDIATLICTKCGLVFSRIFYNPDAVLSPIKQFKLFKEEMARAERTQQLDSFREQAK